MTRAARATVRWIPVLGLVALLLGSSFGFVSCGEYRSASDTIEVSPGSASMTAGSDPAAQAAITELVDLYQSYSASEELSEFPEDYADTQQEALTELLQGGTVTLAQTAALLMLPEAELPDPSGAIVQEEHPVVTFRWVGPDEQLDSVELPSRVALTFPNARVASLASLTQALLAFDARALGGDGDSRLSRAESGLQGLVIGAVLGLSEGELRLQVAVSPAEAPLVHALTGKFARQMGFRPDAETLATLPLDDLRAEWSAFALDLLRARKSVAALGGVHEIRLDQARALLGLYGLTLAREPSKLAAFYDSKLSGGDANGKLSVLESFQLAADARHAGRFLRALSAAAGQGSGATADSIPPGLVGSSLQANPLLMAQLTRLFPETGACLFLTQQNCRPGSLAGAALRTSYYAKLPLFDATHRGGDANGRLDAAELTMALSYVGLLDALFFQYDTNHDSKMSRTEAQAILTALGITDPRAVGAFFANVSTLRPGTVAFWEGFQVFIVNASGVEYLRPHEFYRRMEKILANYF
ncbi:MAG: hypothetical protein IT285_06450 [Bdellovibrionales bacterium]|nr:hypothetical protein [Bdellovibrionales bacterium]